MSPPHAGRDAVEVVRAALEPAADRLRDDADGFAWRPHAFEQRVRTQAPRADGACVVEVSMALLRDVAGRGPELALLAARNAREPGLSSLRWDSAAGEVALRAGVVARPGDGGAAARRLAHAALLQVGDAVLAADALSLGLPGATLAESQESAAGNEPAPQADAWRAYAAGAAAAAAPLADAVARLVTLANAPWQRASRAAHGLDAEIACGGGAGATPGAGLALLRASALQPHPRLGPGLVLALVPPEGTEPFPERAAATAALLNEAEAREWTGVDALGGWCLHPSAGLAHVAFVPALAVEEDTVELLARQAAVRAQWVVEFLARVRPQREAAGPTR